MSIYFRLMKKCGEMKAMTVPELLVVMIITGILVLALFEGMELVGKYVRQYDREIERSRKVFYDYRLLERWFAVSDSACYVERKLIFYQEGKERGRLEYRDSCWRMDWNGVEDTLFRGMEKIQMVPGGDRTRVDCLYVFFPLGGRTERFDFAFPVKVAPDREE